MKARERERGREATLCDTNWSTKAKTKHENENRKTKQSSNRPREHNTPQRHSPVQSNPTPFEPNTLDTRTIMNLQAIRNPFLHNHNDESSGDSNIHETTSPSQPHKGSPGRRLWRRARIQGTSRRRLNAANEGVTEQTVKHRRHLNAMLKKISQSIQKDLTLGPEGICYFQYKKFIVVIEVPDDSSASYFIYTMVYQLEENDDRAGVLTAAMQLNYMQQRTRGSCLGLEDDEVNLCYSGPICGLCRDELVRSLEDFLLTAEEINVHLDEVKLGHGPMKKVSAAA